MNKIFFIVLLIVLGGVAYFSFTRFADPGAENVTQRVTESINKIETEDVSILAQGLDTPWAIAFLPDGKILVTERKGTVRLIEKNGELNGVPIAEIDQVKEIGEGGLHGIAVDPQFSNNGYVYVYYTYGGSGASTLNRVSRFVFEENKLTDEKIIVDAIPGASNHDGGRIKFGPDNYLYIATGDAQNPSHSQNINSLAGKILRVDGEGNPAPDNPFNNLVYSYGHRNPQGLTWDASGQLWATEHGQSATDELNKIEAGNNYGWPETRGDQTKEGTINPAIHSGNETWAPSGADFLTGSIYFTGLRGQALYQAKLVGDNVSVITHFKNEFGRLREVVAGPDGMLYVTTSNLDGRGNPREGDDKVLIINPEKL